MDEKVIILMDSGREIITTHNREEIVGFLNEKKGNGEIDPNMVVQEIVKGVNDVKSLRWTEVVKSKIEGYANI